MRVDLKIKNFVLLASFLLLCGFRSSQAAVQLYQVDQGANPETRGADASAGEARLRINNDHLMFYVYTGTACAPQQANGVYNYSPSQNKSVKEILLFRKPKPSGIGMPQRPQMPVMYNEYRIPAGVPITVATGFYSDIGSANRKGLNVTTTCGPVFSTFIAEEGKDYELESPQRKNVCASVVTELDASGKKSVLPIDTTVATVCTQDGMKLVPVKTGSD